MVHGPLSGRKRLFSAAALLLPAGKMFYVRAAAFLQPNSQSHRGHRYRNRAKGIARGAASMAARGTLTAMDQGTTAGRGMAVLPKA